jgi:protein-S-isoprenylcysteine O-methyltransferase Ste14
MSRIGVATARPDVRRVQHLRKIAVRASSLLALALVMLSQSAEGLGELHQVIETLGLVMIGVCVIGRAWCSLYIGGRKMREIVARGPFSVVRNPLYVFSMIGAAGLGLQSGSIVLGIVFALATWGIFSWVVRGEEAELHERFGRAYDDYVARVPRFLPRVGLWTDGSHIEIEPRLFLLTLRDGLVFPALIPLFQLIDWAQAAGYLPVLLRLP